MKTICLVMIVKNETEVLTRCFNSVWKYLDYWVICDTGSTDGTQELIANYFKEKDIPGELLEHEWVNFGHNRTLAVQAAKGKADYLVLMDADFVFCIKDAEFKHKSLDKDGYQIKYEGSLDYKQMLFVSGKKDWRYVGVTHEFITFDGPKIFDKLDAFTFDHLCDGGNRSDKFERDIRLLTKGLEDEPDNGRYMFYLAQSHKDLRHWDQAIKYYEMRIKKGGWSEEIYYSLYQVGLCKMKRGDSVDKFKIDLLKAYKCRSIRLESLYHLIRYCRLNGMCDMGFNYGIDAINNSYPDNDMLFIDKDIHVWKFYDELALCSYYVDKPKISLDIYNRILDLLPSHYKRQGLKNYEWFKKKYKEQITTKYQEETNSERVAIIIVNYNMKERANAIYNNINETVKHPHDIILVDNGSDLIQHSDKTTIRLKNNVQTTHGWLMGLHYADSLSITKGYKYFAYCFVITSAEMVETEEDIIHEMVTIMKNDPSVVGVHPSLTADSTTWWDHMKNDSTKTLEQVYFVDNIFSCYKASWFDKIGRFQPNLTYAWGIDIETGYFADRDNKKIILDHSVQVKKETNIGYKMDRMNMTADDRKAKATKEMEDYFEKTYGSSYKHLLYRKLKWRKDYNNN